MRNDAYDFAEDRYECFNGYADNISVQDNFHLIGSCIQESADKHMPSKTSRHGRSLYSVPWITLVVKRKIRKRNKTHTNNGKRRKNKG